MKRYWLKKWKRKLGVNCNIRFEYVSRDMITNELKSPTHLVGCYRYKDGWIIVHDRRLKEDDIIHELLHIKDKRWSEKTVKTKTEELWNTNQK